MARNVYLLISGYGDHKLWEKAAMGSSCLRSVGGCRLKSTRVPSGGENARFIWLSVCNAMMMPTRLEDDVELATARGP